MRWACLPFKSSPALLTATKLGPGTEALFLSSKLNLSTGIPILTPTFSCCSRCACFASIKLSHPEGYTPISRSVVQERGGKKEEIALYCMLVQDTLKLELGHLPDFKCPEYVLSQLIYPARDGQSPRFHMARFFPILFVFVS